MGSRNRISQILQGYGFVVAARENDEDILARGLRLELWPKLAEQITKRDRREIRQQHKIKGKV